MKIVFLSLPMLFSMLACFAQYEYYRPVYNTTDMNVNADVKKITESSSETNKKGESVNGFVSTNTYYYDKNKRLRTIYELVGQAGQGTLTTTKYGTKNNQIVTIPS